MGKYVIRAGSRSERGVRPNNEDRLVADTERHVYLVADGMGGQEAGERASGLAADIIPRVVRDVLAHEDNPGRAVRQALHEANEAIVREGRDQPVGRRMGTTAVLAVARDDQIYVAGLGDSRAYLIRGPRAEQLTVDHSMAQMLADTNRLTREQARNSPWQHVLYRFLGCADMEEEAEVQPLIPEAGDRLLLATDGLTNHVGEDDLVEGVSRYPDPQALAEHLVELALHRGSRDNVTCIVVALDRE